MRMRSVLIGIAALAVSMVAMPTVVAGASSSPDGGCYTGCAPPPQLPASGTPAGSTDPVATGTGATPAVTPTPSSGGLTSLPFTGADVEELAVIGVGALVAGGLLVRRRRSNLAA
jgi:LPXTG-motif cell wall-anchored protein